MHQRRATSAATVVSDEDRRGGGTGGRCREPRWALLLLRRAGESLSTGARANCRGSQSRLQRRLLRQQPLHLHLQPNRFLRINRLRLAGAQHHDVVEQREGGLFEIKISAACRDPSLLQIGLQRRRRREERAARHAHQNRAHHIRSVVKVRRRRSAGCRGRRRRVWRCGRRR